MSVHFQCINVKLNPFSVGLLLFQSWSSTCLSPFHSSKPFTTIVNFRRTLESVDHFVTMIHHQHSSHWQNSMSVSGQFRLLHVEHIVSQRYFVLWSYCLKNRSQKQTLLKNLALKSWRSRRYLAYYWNDSGPIIVLVGRHRGKLVVQRRCFHRDI